MISFNFERRERSGHNVEWAYLYIWEGHFAAQYVRRFELPPVGGVRYFGFVDPSGGSQDSFTLAIAHQEKGTAVLDCVRERRPPFSPEAVVREFAELLKAYRVSTVSGDRYAGEWPREQFRKHGISYKPSEKDRSTLYLELLPAINSGKVELLDHKRLVSQLAGLERRTSRVGRDSIDHSPGAHDDVANAAAGALVLVAAERKRMSWRPIGSVEVQRGEFVPFARAESGVS